MKNYLIAERYAMGLNAAITEDASLEAVLKAMQRLSAIYVTEHDFRSALANPAIDVERRAGVLSEVLQREGMPAPVVRLAEVLLRRGRVALVPDVAAVFAMIVDRRLGRVATQVTTAVPLADDQRRRLTDTLEAFSGKTVRVEWDVDEAIVGGVVARIGGALIDGSLQTRLERMKQALLAEET